MKTCSDCKVEKYDSCFRIRKEKRVKKQGSRGVFTYLNNVCRDCERIRARDYGRKISAFPKYKELNRIRAKERYHKNKEKCKAALKKRRESEHGKETRRQYDLINKDKIKHQHRIVAKKWHEYHRDNITDTYCIQLIRSQNGGKNKCVITPEMIETKRLQIQIKRKIYETQQQVKQQKIDAPGSDGWINTVFQGAY